MRWSSGPAGGGAGVRTTCTAYRDDSGQLHTVSATCTHVGCIVAFNDAEKTWGCPCQGSRFDTGEVLPER
jgi:Rieske Fe-S protein